MDIHVACRHFFQKFFPDWLQRCWVFVGQSNETHAMLMVQPSNFIGQFSGVAMPPTLPKTVLPAVGAAMWTTTRKLHNCCAPQTKTLIIVPVFYQFPGSAEFI